MAWIEGLTGRQRLRRRVWMAGLGIILNACLVDSDRPCNEHQVERDDVITGCECAEGYVASADGTACVSCGPNARALGTECTCLPGYYRNAGSGECEPLEGGVPDGELRPDGEGKSCSSQADCEGLEADYCQQLISPNICLVQHCATGENECAAPYVCCVFRGIEVLAETEGLCIPESNCVAPGEVVSR